MNGVNATDVILIFHARSKQFLSHVSIKKRLLKIDPQNKKDPQNENEQLCFDFGASDY